MRLHPGGELPIRPRRILVAGASGSGKTMLATRIAARLQLPRVELDALHHGPGWVARPGFAADVAAFAATPEWVSEWQYDAVRPLLAERAELLIWLDLPRRTQMRQVIQRTAFRRLRGTELWNGNREAPLLTVFTDPEHVIRWAWRSYHPTREKVLRLRASHPRLPVIRVTSRRAALVLLRAVERAGGDRPA